MAQNSLNFICLFDLNAQSDGVNGGFDEDALIFVARDGQGIEKYFFGPSRFYFGFIMSFYDLRRKVLKGESSCQRRPDCGQVGSQNVRHWDVVILSGRVGVVVLFTHSETRQKKLF